MNGKKTEGENLREKKTSQMWESCLQIMGTLSHGRETYLLEVSQES